MSKIVGIDLGTTNSVIAVLENGDPVVIASAEGGRTVPSVVAFNKHKERLVGQTAKRQAVINAENTIYSVKRLMGRAYDDLPADERARLPYSIVRGTTGDARVQIPATHRDYTPQEISAMILGKLKKDAEAYLGEEVTRAVITVPAYFNDAQRQATKDAGRIAGLEVLRIINEPTAASLAYGLDKKTNETILVFDLGGGTFDVSVLEVGDGVVEVKATSGDTHLGGDDWDETIVQWMIAEFRRETGIDLAADRQALQRLKEAAEKAKIELSSVVQTEINLPFITANASGPQHLNLTLTRARFEQLSADLLARLEQPVRQALRDAVITRDAIQEVVLVGGATRMPMVQALVERLLGKPANKSVNPDEVVAIGAALQAGVLSGEVKDILLLDVTPLSLGLETLGGVMTTLIPRNTTVPVRRAEVFSTAADNQSAVDITVYQGERPIAADNMLLGQFRLDGLPAAPRGVPQIEVTFDIDANGILNVSARDKATGKEQKITITASTNLSRAEVDRLVREAQQNRTQDEIRAEAARIRNEADAVIYQVEKTLTSLGEQADSATRMQLEAAVNDLRSAIRRDDTNAVRNQTEALRQMVERLGHAAPQPGSREDVVEGQFSEV